MNILSPAVAIFPSWECGTFAQAPGLCSISNNENPSGLGGGVPPAPSREELAAKFASEMARLGSQKTSEMGNSLLNLRRLVPTFPPEDRLDGFLKIAALTDRRLLARGKAAEDLQRAEGAVYGDLVRTLSDILISIPEGEDRLAALVRLSQLTEHSREAVRKEAGFAVYGLPRYVSPCPSVRENAVNELNHPGTLPEAKSRAAATLVYSFGGEVPWAAIGLALDWGLGWVGGSRSLLFDLSEEWEWDRVLCAVDPHRPGERLHRLLEHLRRREADFRVLPTFGVSFRFSPGTIWPMRNPALLRQAVARELERREKAIDPLLVSVAGFSTEDQRIAALAFQSLVPDSCMDQRTRESEGDWVSIQHRTMLGLPMDQAPSAAGGPYRGDASVPRTWDHRWEARSRALVSFRPPLGEGISNLPYRILKLDTERRRVEILITERILAWHLSEEDWKATHSKPLFGKTWRRNEREFEVRLLAAYQAVHRLRPTLKLIELAWSLQALMSSTSPGLQAAAAEFRREWMNALAGAGLEILATTDWRDRNAAQTEHHLMMIQTQFRNDPDFKRRCAELAREAVHRVWSALPVRSG
jgi:hypothetical protein